METTQLEPIVVATARYTRALAFVAAAALGIGAAAWAGDTPPNGLAPTDAAFEWLDDANPLDPSYTVISVDVVQEVNRLPYAQIRLHDGDPATGEFPISEADVFDLGAEISIDARYEGESDFTIFTGLVVGHGIEASVDGSILVVQSGKSTRELVRRARQELSGVGAKVFGVVLNNVNIKREGYNDYDYYRYSSSYNDSYRRANAG